jgi:dolichol-phosphate mannosyltransferase
VEGWSYLMVIMLVVSGIQLLMLGILGEYLWRNLEASRNRPAFIVDKIIGFEKSRG